MRRHAVSFDEDPRPPTHNADRDAHNGGGTPDDVWHTYFSGQTPSPTAVRELIFKLHKGGKHEQVIAVIEAALLHGQSQPWMYDVLALSMRIAGRPQAEVERALLSRVDFTASDVPSMLYSAAYLTRFGAHEQALRLYRQASELAPHRPEPYVLGLELARRQNDYDAVRWAATGILTTAWTRDHQRLHREAENALLEARQALQKAGRTAEAAEIEQALREARKRDLILKLTWNGEGDLDLIVDEPPGTVCSFDNPQSPGGGVLVHDGYGPDQDNCYEEYVCAFGMPGTYRVRIRHVWGGIVGKRALLQVTRYGGTSQERVDTFTVPLAPQDVVVRVGLKDGRRTELAHIENQPLVLQRPRRLNLRKQLGPLDLDARQAGQRFADSRRRAGAFTVGVGSNIGFAPVVSVLSEGVSMSAMAVVSGDRRYVRLTTLPFFSAITDVFTFSFVNSGGNLTGNPGVGGSGQGGGAAGAAP